jgi:chromatin structure-remodeling complex protein RSC7
MLERRGKQFRKHGQFGARANIRSGFNSALTAARDENNEGHYDIHTNTLQWPKTMQPTHARWETVKPEGANAQQSGQGRLTNGTHDDEDDVGQELSSIFQRLDPVYPRNFMIHDIHLKSAPDSSLGPPGLDTDPQSLSNLPSDIVDELPADCRQAFEEAKKREMAWKSQWNTEATDGKRGKFMPTVDWFP